MKLKHVLAAVGITAAIIAANATKPPRAEYELPVRVYSSVSGYTLFQDAEGNLRGWGGTPAQSDCTLIMDNMGTAELTDDEILEVIPR